MTIKDLVDRAIVVNVRSEEEALSFVAYVVENGFVINEWSREDTRYWAHKADTCYEIESSAYMYYSDIEYYTEHGYKIVTMDEIEEFCHDEIAPSARNVNVLFL